MRVLHLSPTFFSDASIVGGAERYTWEIARAMAGLANVTMVSFGPETRTDMRDGVRVRQLKRHALIAHQLAASPLSLALVREISRADVVHCHQVDTFLTGFGIVAARALRKPVFVTDLGGGHMYAPTNYLPLLTWSSGALLISEFSKSLWEQAPAARRPPRLDVIYGGVDTTHFAPGGAKDPQMVAYIGRLLPHKGIEYLIDAIEPPFRLHVVGRPYDLPYLAMLKERAQGKSVVFEHDVDDRGLIERYQRAAVSVLPSVSTDWQGKTTEVAELFGLVVVEAMACGTPVIVSRTTSLPELVDDGTTGFIVPPADAMALRHALRVLRDQPARAADMGTAARASVLARFTWRATAEKSLAVYRAVRASSH